MTDIMHETDLRPVEPSLAEMMGWLAADHARIVPRVNGEIVADETSQADCCGDWMGCDCGTCPKHHPEAYAEYMAAHTPESIS